MYLAMNVKTYANNSMFQSLFSSLFILKELFFSDFAQRMIPGIFFIKLISLKSYYRIQNAYYILMFQFTSFSSQNSHFSPFFVPSRTRLQLDHSLHRIFLESPGSPSRQSWQRSQIKSSVVGGWGNSLVGDEVPRFSRGTESVRNTIVWTLTLRMSEVLSLSENRFWAPFLPLPE